MTDNKTEITEKVTLEKWRDRSWENEVAITQIYSLAMLGSSIPSDVLEFLTEVFPFEKLFTELDSDEKKILDRGFGEYSSWEVNDIVSEFLNTHDVYGFVAEVQSPVFSPNGAYSWGHAHVYYIYAETIDELFEKAFAVALEGQERDKQKESSK